VIDRDEKLRTTIEALLSAAGCEVRQAAAVEHALPTVDVWQPTLIFLERGDTEETHQAIQSLWNAAGRRIPVILLGTSDAIGPIFLAQDYLPKPFDVRELLSLAERYAPCSSA
jgi:DNA-binding response OmpR family regulator